MSTRITALDAAIMANFLPKIFPAAVAAASRSISRRLRTPRHRAAHEAIAGAPRHRLRGGGWRVDRCACAGLPAALAPITRAELEDADEVFITSTAGGVMPVSRVMSRIMGNDRPGPVFARIHDAYWAWHADPRHATPVRATP